VGVLTVAAAVINLLLWKRRTIFFGTLFAALGVASPDACQEKNRSLHYGEFRRKAFFGLLILVPSGAHLWYLKVCMDVEGAALCSI